MCGIAGSVKSGGKNAVDGILRSLAHRGPDDVGVYSDAENDVHLGQRRLSIIDLSSAGRQPMANEDGSIWLTFNGEIYNYKKLKPFLTGRGHKFRSETDSEVIIHGYEEFGTKIFEKLDGMWAAALYDRSSGKLILSRDPAGIKPLYLIEDGQKIIFSSEIGALKSNCQAGTTLNESSLVKFMAQGYIYGDETIYKEIKEVPVATNLVFNLKEGGSFKESNYNFSGESSVKTLEEGIRSFKNTFNESVRQSLQADVPVGIFLSGGIDSSLVGHYVKENGADLKVFTIGFEEKDFDESRIAREISRALGFKKHFVHILKPKDISDKTGEIIDLFGEPFGDMSSLPTYYLSMLARENDCRVVLSGDGGDELFGGYPTQYLPEIVSLYSKTPDVVHQGLVSLADYLPSTYSKLGFEEMAKRFLHGAKSDYRKGHFLWKVLFRMEDVKNILKKDFYEKYVSEVFERGFSDFFDEEPAADKVSEVINVDFKTFLASNCLVKSDICSMAHAVELRVPFLNRPVLEFARTLPSEYKTKPFQTKILLRKTAEEILPASITKIKKKGFVPPLSRWLQGELKGFMLENLSRDNVYKTGLLNYDAVDSLVNSHLKGKRDNTRQIWSLISLVRFLNKAK